MKMKKKREKSRKEEEILQIESEVEGYILKGLRIDN
jgi:hypothetical protein